MSYSFRIAVEDGKPAVVEDSVSGIVPDGLITVSGHEDAGNASIGVTRYDPASSKVIAQASGYAAKA